MTDAELKRLRMRFLVVPVVLVVLAICCRLHVMSVGHTHTMELVGRYGDAPVSAEDITIEPADMARVTKVERGADGTPLVTVEALRPGRGRGTVTTERAGEMFRLRVDQDGVVYSNGVNFTGWQAVAASIVLGFALTSALCAHAGAVLFRRAWYDYDMVAYVGGGIFCTVEALSLALVLRPSYRHEFIDFLAAVTNAAEDFVALTFVPMGLAAALLCVSNLQLIRHEGMRPVNVLGIVASILWTAVNALMAFVHEIEGTTLDPDLFWFTLLSGSALSAAIAFAETLLLATSLSAWLASRHRPSAPRSPIIVLGCGIRPDGTPTPLLAGRLDAALDFARAQGDAGCRTCTFVASGGAGPDEVTSEAASMAGYLKRHGIDDRRILVEDRSTSTTENFALSRRVMEAAGEPLGRVAFATTNYHVFRGYVCAHDAGLAAEGIASPTRLYFWPNAFLREVAGFVVARWPRVLASFLIICGLYVLAEYALLIQ